ncbi:hypothetical protein HELRODRAFT_175813 [Helobdella robusta]|uniref:DDE-1 domain-containing protein n=1 Tax=Helobdella robusta TaxID=6412 RepID=T1F9P9_HELRO|nr:hypothetical protein HELRODRAFT_175813 [Helobdella robusta]ESO00396.1 hypothetical protein HELRODRAFT_175813 [Helobdella robusta]
MIGKKGFLRSGFLPENIFNADETGLYYRSLLQRSLVLKSDKRKGIKTAKEKITVLLACSQTGEKLPPLVIGYISKKILMLSLEERTVKRRGQFGHSPMVSSLEDFYCTGSKNYQCDTRKFMKHSRKVISQVEKLMLISPQFPMINCMNKITN